MAWFRRDKNEDESMDPQVLLAKAQATAPAASAPLSFDKPATGFRMTIEDVFSIAGRGTVVTGRVEAGSISKGATLHLTRVGGSTRELEVTGIEMFRKIVDTATTGDNVGLLLKDVGRDDVGQGDTLSA
jgi:translation elongation factor EF-Tu-like GTPase